MGADELDANRDTLDDEPGEMISAGGGVLDTGLDGVAFSETILKKAPILIYILDTNEETLEINREMRQVTGYDITDCPDGDSILDALYPDPTYRKLVRKMHVGWKRNHQVRGLLTNVTTRDGGIRSISWTTTRVKLDGAPIANMAVGLDATELTRMKDWVLIQARTLNCVQEGVLLVDNDGQIIRAAGATSRLLSQDAMDIEDKTLSMLIADSSRNSFLGRIDEDPTEPLIADVEMVDGTGAVRPMEVRVQAVKIEEDVPLVRAILLNPPGGTSGSGAGAAAARHESQLAKLRKESRSKDSRAEELTREVQRLETELDSRERELNSISGRSAEIESRKSAEIGDLKQRLEKDLKEAREAALRTASEGHNRFQAQQDELEETRKEHAIREQEILDSAEAQREALRRELVEKASTERKALLEQMMRSSTQLEALKRELADAGSTDLTRMQEELQKRAAEDLVALRSELEAKANEDLTALREELEEQQGTERWIFEQEVAERTARIESLEEEVERKVQAALAEQQAAFDQRAASEGDALLDNLATQAREIKRLEDELKSATAATGDHDARGQELEAKLGASQRELEDKTAEFEATRRDRDQQVSDALTSLREELLNQASQEREALEKELTKQATEAQRALEEVHAKKADEERKALTDALALKTAELESVRRELEESLADQDADITLHIDADAEIENDALLVKLKASQRELEELRQQLAESDAAKQSAEQRVTDVERRLIDEIADLKGEHEAGIAEQRALSTTKTLEQASQIEGLNEQIERAVAAEAAAQVRQEELEHRLATEIAGLTERLKTAAEVEKIALSQQLESLRQQLEDRQQALTSSDAARQEAEQQAQQVEQRHTSELASLRQEFETGVAQQKAEAEALLAAQTGEIASLRDQIAQSREAEAAVQQQKAEDERRLVAEAEALEQRLTAQSNDERAALQRQIEARAARLGAMEQQLETKTGECVYLQQELNQQAASLEGTRQTMAREKRLEHDEMEQAFGHRLSDALEEQAARLREAADATLAAKLDELEVKLEDRGHQLAAEHEASLDEVRQGATAELTEYRQQTAVERKGLLDKLLEKSTQVELLQSQFDQMAQRAQSNANALDEQVSQQAALVQQLEQKATVDRDALVAEMEQNKAIELADLRAALEQQGASLAADVRKSLQEDHEAALALIQQQHAAAIEVHNRATEQEHITRSQELASARKEGAKHERVEMQGRVQRLLDRLNSQLSKQSKELEQERTRADDLGRQLKESKDIADQHDPEALQREITSRLAETKASHSAALGATTSEKEQALAMAQELREQLNASEKKSEAALERLRAQRGAEIDKLRLDVTALKEENASLRANKPSTAQAAPSDSSSLRKEVEFLDKQLSALGLGNASFVRMARDQANTMAEFSGTAAVVCSANGRIVSWSDGAAQLCGVPADEARGQLLHRDVMKLKGHDWRKLVAQTTMDKPLTEAVTVERADGTVVPTLLVAVGMKSDEGRPSGFIEICRSFEPQASAQPRPAVEAPPAKKSAAQRKKKAQRPSGDAWADVFTGGQPLPSDSTNDAESELDLSDAELEIPDSSPSVAPPLSAEDKVEVDLDEISEDKEESLTIKPPPAADKASAVVVEQPDPEPPVEAPKEAPKKNRAQGKPKRKITVKKITTITPDGKTKTIDPGKKTADEKKANDKQAKDKQAKDKAEADKKTKKKKKPISERAKQQKRRTKNLQGQVKFLQDFLDLYSERIEVVRPDPLDDLWERDEPVHFKLKGLECEFETVAGKRIRRSEHLFRVEFGEFFPKKRSQMFLYYDWKEAGGVPFHPNIVSPYAHDNPKQKPGYVCIFARVATTPTIPWAIQQLAWMLRYDNVNPKQPHAELNPRALEAWTAKELKKSTEEWPFPWGGNAAKSKS